MYSITFGCGVISERAGGTHRGSEIFSTVETTAQINAEPEKIYHEILQQEILIFEVNMFN